MPEKIKGTVKWFSNRKGFGFVSPSTGGDDIFLHHSRIVSDADYKTLVSEKDMYGGHAQYCSSRMYLYFFTCIHAWRPIQHLVFFGEYAVVNGNASLK